MNKHYRAGTNWCDANSGSLGHSPDWVIGSFPRVLCPRFLPAKRRDGSGGGRIGGVSRVSIPSAATQRHLLAEKFSAGQTSTDDTVNDETFAGENICSCFVI